MFCGKKGKQCEGTEMEKEQKNKKSKKREGIKKGYLSTNG